MELNDPFGIPIEPKALKREQLNEFKKKHNVEEVDHLCYDFPF
jgi:hypothetical protein